MLIRVRKNSQAKPSEITPEALYLDRRNLLRAMGLVGAAAAVSGPALAAEDEERPPFIGGVRKSAYDPGEEPTAYEDVTRYNNFYEFGTGKSDPERNARDFKPEPWTVTIAGEVARPGTYDFDDLVKPHALEERIYRHRCVEAWSMVVPWVGIPLADVIKRFEPTGRAKYVAFETLYEPIAMPGQRYPVLDWPYREGLRLDEAMNPLTILAVGLYGRALPNQNGAPIRLVVPWKYGFKGIKSIVAIRFLADRPRTTWNDEAPREYGFYANVNPEVDHPRWSQARERRIGEWFKRDTLMFNGYAEEVAHLYAGMDLAKNF